MGLSKLTTGERVTAVSGTVLFVTVALPWFRLSNEFGLPGNTKNGWESGLHWGGPPAALAAIAVAAVLLHRVGDVALPKLAVPWPVAHLVGAALAAAIVLLKLMTGRASYDRAWGLLLAAPTSLVFLAGGCLIFQEHRAARR